MTMHDRMLAFVRGEPHDRVPFVQYNNIAAPNREVWSLVGRGNVGVLKWTNAHRLEFPHCRFVSEPTVYGELEGERKTLYTPAGAITEERIFEPAYSGPAWKKHFVETPDDYRVLMAYLRDVVVCEDYERVWRDAEEVGEDGLPHVAVQRTPYQQLWVEWTGLAHLTEHMADYTELVAECIELMTAIQRQIFHIVRRGIQAGVPIHYVDIPDNVTAPVLGKRNFAKYCVPPYQELADLLAPCHVPVFVHMDGGLQPLWHLIGESGVRGLDSMSPPPDNDTSVAQALAMWPEMRIGINFPSSVHLLPPAEVYSSTMQILHEGGRSGRLQIQVSENVPEDVWRTSYPQIVKAIRDFSAS
jgi:hypothetical protein